MHRGRGKGGGGGVEKKEDEVKRNLCNKHEKTVWFSFAIVTKQSVSPTRPLTRLICQWV